MSDGSSPKLSSIPPNYSIFWVTLAGATKIKDGFLKQDLPKLKTGEQNNDFFFKPQSYAMACYAVKNSWSVWTQFMHLD